MMVLMRLYIRLSQSLLDHPTLSPTELCQPLPQKKSQKNPNVTTSFLSPPIESQPRKEVPPLNKETTEFVERLAVVKPNKKKEVFRPPPLPEYDKRNLPPITGAKASHIQHLSTTLPISAKMKRNRKYTELVQPFVLPVLGGNKQKKK